MILLIEDNNDIIDGLTYSFRESGYDIKALKSFKESINYLKDNNPELIILDVTLPDGNGFILYEKYISIKNISTIFLTANDSEEDIIKGFHKILKEGTSDSRKEWFTVGDYKKLSNEVGGLKTTEPKNVERDMKKLLEWYDSLKQVTIKDIIEFHARFEKIHPFQDGNGRVGRIIAFKECLKNNIVPFIILDKDKLFYYRGLNQYQSNKEKGYLIDTCLNAQDQYTEMVKYYLKSKYIPRQTTKNVIT